MGAAGLSGTFHGEEDGLCQNPAKNSLMSSWCLKHSREKCNVWRRISGAVQAFLMSWLKKQFSTYIL